jgi:hypothetical protein
MSYAGYNVEALRQVLEEKSKRLKYGDEGHFIVGLEEIAALLTRLDPPPSPILRAVDAKGQDYATYYFTAYSDLTDIDASLEAYRYVRDFVRVIILTDRFFEVRNERYRRIALALLSKIRHNDQEFIKNIANFNLKQCWQFWKFEQHTRKLMTQDHTFSRNDVRYYNLFKSSDAPMLYCAILESVLPNFNRNVSLVFHYNQALQDIDDDFDDIREDLHDQMPNIFLLASVGRGKSNSYSALHRHRLNGSRDSVIYESSAEVMNIVKEYVESIEAIDLPDQFRFLKYLSRHYADRITKKVATATKVSYSHAAAIP